MHIPILYADSHFVVLNKPAGLPVHAGPRGGPSVEDCFAHLSRRKDGPWLAHRLDADTAGFVAATYLRGVPFIQVPTTLVAQIDSSIGGKTGVDLPEGKNLVGSFHEPAGVLCDLDALATLPRPDLVAGLAEVTDATRAVLCDGDETAVRFVTDELVVGQAMGTVDEGVPTVPLGVSRDARWKRLTARSVPVPNRPSSLTLKPACPSACCSRRTSRRRSGGWSAHPRTCARWRSSCNPSAPRRSPASSSVGCGHCARIRHRHPLCHAAA